MNPITLCAVIVAQDPDMARKATAFSRLSENAQNAIVAAAMGAGIPELNDAEKEEIAAWAARED